MERNKLYSLIDFPLRDTKNGSLVMFQYNKSESNLLPFPIKRVLVMKGMKGKDVRGGHTHHKTNQILLCISGSCTVNLENGDEKSSVKIDSMSQGLLLYPYVWHTMQDFAEDTILLVLADTEYDEKDYIRDYNQFLGYVKK